MYADAQSPEGQTPHATSAEENETTPRDSWKLRAYCSAATPMRDALALEIGGWLVQRVP